MADDLTSTLRNRIEELARGEWKSAVRMIDTALICPDPFHEKKKFDEAELSALAAEIRRDGLKNPLTVCAIGTLHHPLFRLISGERRLAACLHGAITPIPCVIVGVTPDDLQSTGEIPAPRNYFEEAALLHHILKNGSSISELAEKIGTSPEKLERKLELTRLREEEQRFLLAAGVSEESASNLLLLSPASRAECYRMMAGGICGKDADKMIAELCGKRRVKIAIQDSRLFYNTIDKAIRIMREAGVAITMKREECDAGTRLTILVPRAP